MYSKSFRESFQVEEGKFVAKYLLNMSSNDKKWLILLLHLFGWNLMLIFEGSDSFVIIGGASCILLLLSKRDFYCFLHAIRLHHTKHASLSIFTWFFLLLFFAWSSSTFVFVKHQNLCCECSRFSSILCTHLLWN